MHSLATALRSARIELARPPPPPPPTQPYIGSPIAEEDADTELASYAVFSNDIDLLVDPANEVRSDQGMLHRLLSALLSDGLCSCVFVPPLRNATRQGCVRCVAASYCGGIGPATTQGEVLVVNCDMLQVACLS